MTASVLDHLVVAAPDLVSGARYVREMLGVAVQAGGAHARMGTHNLLLRLGEKLYLEVIAIDLAAPNPGRARWFDLDRLDPNTLPSLVSWVVRTDNIAALSAATGEVLGVVESMQRGALEWLITVTPDGVRPFDGVGPAMIEWRTDRHPEESMVDAGVALTELVIEHPAPEGLRTVLAKLNVSGGVQLVAAPVGQPARLLARFDTPNGSREMRSHATRS